MDKFDQNKFESIEFNIESAETPKIKQGGSSSSNTLNRFFNDGAQDLALIGTRTNILAARADRIINLASAQAGALLAQFQSLSTRVDSASSYDQVLADMHSSYYVNTGATTATINNVFGQCTLPVRTQTDLIVQNDVYGNAYIFSDVELSYSTLTSPTSLDYVVDPEGLNMLKGEQAWILDPISSVAWIKLKAPLQFRGLIPNVLEIWPVPAFGLDIYEVSYQKAGTSFSSTWYSLDLSYLPGYNNANGRVEKAGPIRLHLPNEPISQIRMKVSPVSANTAWGLHRLKLYNTQYESSASLVVKDPYSRTLSGALVRGKDPSELSLLTVTLNSNQATIALITTDTTSTPVITGVILDI
jgi:hypothetical protein